MSKPTKKFTTQASLDSHIWAACDILRRSNCAGALQYVPELTWLLFLRILDIKEEGESEVAATLSKPYQFSLEEPYRWKDWAAPFDKKELEKNPKAQGNKRYTLTEKSSSGTYFQFVNQDLLPYLKKLRDKPNATSRQKVISEMIASVDRTKVDSEKNFQDVLDKIHQIKQDDVDDTHIFTLSQVYEGLLLKMGEKGNDGGQFFTPREVVRAVIQTVDPKIGDTVYDPCCGTGGFLAQAYEYMFKQIGKSADDIEILKQRTFYGREKENLVYPVALANLVLHGIDEPHIWHGNTLSGEEAYGGLFSDSPELYDVIITNPPFGGKENKDVQNNFEYKTSATQVLFLQHVMKKLNSGGKCGIVVDEGVLFRTNESAFVSTKEKLLDECDVYAIVSLPGGVFNSAGAGVKTNLIFFKKGKPTKKIWYYDLSEMKIGKKTPISMKDFEEFGRLLKSKPDTENSWTIDITQKKKLAKLEADTLRKSAKVIQDANPILDKKQEEEVKDLLKKASAIEDSVYDLKAVNPNRKSEEDNRTPKELIDFIQKKDLEISKLLTSLV